MNKGAPGRLDDCQKIAYKMLRMIEHSPTEKPLSSWKEISSYLGCDERTCLRWEKKYGLPVHRAGGSQSKSHVFAYKEELDEWLTRRQEDEAKGPAARPLNRSRLSKRLPLLLGLLPAAVLIVLGARALISKLPGLGASQPYDFRVERSILIVTNKKGAELWSFDTGVADLADEAGYRLHFSHRRVGSDDKSVLPWLKIEDINGDGQVETLVIIKTADDASHTSLICFDSRGNKLWVYSPGREMTFGGKRYSADYALDAVDVLDIGPTVPKKIFVMMRQKPNWPSYIATLSPQGQMLGEYWNAGRFSDYALVDIDNDGVPALVLVGTNNEYRKGFLAVLDLDNVWGCSPQGEDYKSPELKPGSELFYLLFPRTEVDRLEFSQREAMSTVDMLKNNRLMVVALLSRVIYELNQRMEVDMVILSDGFREKYRKYQAEGKIFSGRLDEEAYSEALAKAVVYFDGERWTTTPTRNKTNLGVFLQKEPIRPKTTVH